MKLSKKKTKVCNHNLMNKSRSMKHLKKELLPWRLIFQQMHRKLRHNEILTQRVQMFFQIVETPLRKKIHRR